MTALRSDSAAATEAYGAVLGAALRRGDILGLNGPLGAGKTCLARGIIAGAGGDPTAVRSPTFVLDQPHRGEHLQVHHIDLYRLGSGATLDVIDLDTVLDEGAAVIEWAEYADLTEFAGATIAIDAPPSDDGSRVLRLSGATPMHIARAWASLVEAAAYG